MTIEELYEKYFVWLTSQVSYEYHKHSTRSYDELLRIMHEKEFVWMVPNDDNRVEDGKQLRYLWLHDDNGDRLPWTAEITDHDMSIFRTGPATFLEVLVALAGRLAFQAQGTVGWWAWRLIVNLELHKMRDPLVSARKRDQVQEILETVIWRTYNRDGTGGFFPLAFSDPGRDMTKVEIWYQMHAYLEEYVPT